MLAELAISNFAIIDRLHLTLDAGFSVLTGETGAGKSIIIDAVDALLGARYGAEFVRSGSDTARVEGIFRLAPPPALTARLAELGLDMEDDSIILSREIHGSGRSTARINGRAVPVSVLQEVGQALVDIHGQSEHLSLLRQSEHVNFIDRFGNLMQQRAHVAEKVTRLRAVRRELQSLVADEREIARRVDLLRYQSDEIAAAALHSAEDEELAQERTLLANAEKLSALCASAYVALYEGDEKQRSAVDLLGAVTHALEDLAQLDPSLRDHLSTVITTSDMLSDLSHTLRAYRDNVEFNPERLQEVEERLGLIQTLKRKYGSTIEDILAFGQRASVELNNIVHAEERMAELRKEEESLLRELGSLSAALSRARRAAGETIARRLEQELADLNMRHVRFQASIARSPAADGVYASDEDGKPNRYAFDTSGIDRVEFLISPNPGEPLKPLARVASGGETARVMLALKSILSAADDTPTLIFDEIDVGIGGRSGYVVGEKLWRLTPRHQVICITHLPQVAAYGDRHFAVSKQVAGEHTQTVLRDLAGEERVQEIAAMLGSTSALSLDNARDILRQTQEWKKQQLSSA